MSDAAVSARLGRAERALAEAERLLRRRQAELGAAGGADFEDRLLQGVRELAAVVRDLAAQAGQVSPVSAGHTAELADTATTLDGPAPRRPRQ